MRINTPSNSDARGSEHSDVPADPAGDPDGSVPAAGETPPKISPVPAAGEALPKIPPVPAPAEGRSLSGFAADVAAEHPEAMAELVTSVLGVHPPRWTTKQFEALTGVDGHVLLRMRRAMGFVDPPPGEAVFSEDDLAIVEVITSAMDAGAIDLERQLALNRVLGSAMARVASAAIATFVEALAAEPGTASEGSVTGGLDANLGLEQMVQAVQVSLPMIDRTLGLVWRRHLASAARRAVMAAGSGELDTHTAIVGFADLVEFTERTEQLDEAELAAAMARFDDLAYDTVSALGGRVVKMIGDEVMFVAPTVECAAAISWRLIDLCDVDEALTTLRAGFASGPAIDQDGDVIGPAANLAHRLASLARPGTVLAPADLAPPEVETSTTDPLTTGSGDAASNTADQAVIAQPGATTGYRWTPMRLTREVRGIGQLKLATVRPEVHVPTPASPAEINQLNGLADRAFYDVRSEALGGWSIRLAGGGRRRANSVSTIGPLSMGPLSIDLDDALAIVRSRYETIGLPPRVVITPISEPDGLDEELQLRGWVIEAPTVMMVGDLREIRHLCDRRAARVPLVSHHRPFPSWRVGFDDSAGATADADLAIMYGAAETEPLIADGLGTLRRGLPPIGVPTARTRRLFAAAFETESDPAESVEIEAVGTGIIEGNWLGVFSMWTRTARRRRGLAATVLAELSAWGTGAGCRLAYLQVEESNKAGLSAYSKLGFSEAYRYHYRTAQPPQ